MKVWDWILRLLDDKYQGVYLVFDLWYMYVYVKHFEQPNFTYMSVSVAQW